MNAITEPELYEIMAETVEADRSFLGMVAWPVFARLPGVEYRGKVPHQGLPRHLADVLIIPYKINAFNKGTFSAKIFLATSPPSPPYRVSFPSATFCTRQRTLGAW